MTSSEQIKGMVARTLEEFGQIDILVNNAGSIAAYRPLEMSEEDWRAVIDLNLTGVFLCSQAVGRHMVARRQGRIINMASTNAFIVARIAASLLIVPLKAELSCLPRA